MIPSAINITPDGRCYIGEDAFHSDFMMDGAKMRVGFKQCPKEIEGESEQLMIEYMRSIYARIIIILYILLVLPDGQMMKRKICISGWP